MTRWRLAAAILLLAATQPGCSVFRSIEQWKCDNWGMCHFGVRPSAAQNVQVQAVPVVVPMAPPPCADDAASWDVYSIHQRVVVDPAISE